MLHKIIVAAEVISKNDIILNQRYKKLPNKNIWKIPLDLLHVIYVYLICLLTEGKSLVFQMANKNVSRMQFPSGLFIELYWK